MLKKAFCSKGGRCGEVLGGQWQCKNHLLPRQDTSDEDEPAVAPAVASMRIDIDTEDCQMTMQPPLIGPPKLFTDANMRRNGTTCRAGFASLVGLVFRANGLCSGVGATQLASKFQIWAAD